MSSIISVRRWIRLLGVTLTWAAAIGAGCMQDNRREPSTGSELAQARQLITHGTATEYKKWQGVVGMYSVTKYHVCTATLIHPRLALTGGHCVKNPGALGGFDFTKDPSSLRIYGGADIRVWDGIKPIEYSKVSRVITHPEWNGTVHSADLALLLLTTPVTAKDVVPFALRQGEPSVGSTGWMVGYGRTEAEVEGSDGRPTEAETKLVKIEPRFGEGAYSVIVTGSTPAAACSGDSGGPLFTEQGGKWVLSAVASMSDCASDNLNVNLHNHRSWIETTVCTLLGTALDGSPCKATSDGGPTPKPDGAQARDAGRPGKDSALKPADGRGRTGDLGAGGRHDEMGTSEAPLQAASGGCSFVRAY